MLRTKIITAAVGVPILLLLLYLDSWWLFLPATAAMLLGLQE
ncbi:MAG: phosphatidate cytidylyltransferase, partial [Armatimonadetes bacterium]|nr:phosphatidate cytidylyltransferase [Armatimonadota bacterium]